MAAADPVGCPCPVRNNRIIPEARLAPGPLIADVDCHSRCDIEMVANTVQGLVCAISRMPPPMQQQIFTQVGLPNDDILYAYLRKMNPATKQQLLREILAQNPPTKPEMVEMLRHYDASARRQIMTEVGCDLDKCDVICFLQAMSPGEIKAMLESANIRLIPTDEEMIEVMATYANEVIQRILKRIDYTPCKDEIVKGLLSLCPDEQMQVIAQTNVRAPASEEGVLADMRMLRPDAIQRIIASFGNTAKTDEDMICYLANKPDDEKERLIKLAGMEVVRKEDPYIMEAFCELPPPKKRLAMKNGDFGIYNYDDLVQGLKELETHKQMVLLRDAGVIYQPNEAELIAAVQNQSTSVKRAVIRAMDIIYKKADLLDALKEIEQSVLADVLHEIIMFGGAFKLIDIVNLLKNLSIQDQQAIIEMSELKIVPTELQLINAFTNKPPGVIFKLIKQVGLIPNKKHMLSLLIDFAEHALGIPDLLRALRRAGVDVISDEEMIFQFQLRNLKQQEEIMEGANPEFILCNIENIVKKFRALSAAKQKRWLQILRASIEGIDMLEDIIETLNKMDTVQLDHFMKLLWDNGIIQGHNFSKEQLVDILQRMDSTLRQEAMEESQVMPNMKHLIFILKSMDEYERIRAIRSAGVSVPPTLEEAICAAGQYSHDEVSRIASRLGVCLITENDVIGYVSSLPDGEKKRIAKICHICLCDFQDVLHAFRCLHPQKQKEIAIAAGLMKRRLRLIR